MTMRYMPPGSIASTPLTSHVVLVGPAGAGKTWQLRLLRNQQACVLASIEGGERTLKGTVVAAAPGSPVTNGVPAEQWTYPPFGGAIIDGIRSFEELSALIAIFGGVNPTAQRGEPMTQQHVNESREKFAEHARALDDCETAIFDSVNEMTLITWSHVRWLPSSFNNKGNFDPFSAYRTLGDYMKAFFDGIKRRTDKNVIFCGIVQPKQGGVGWELQAPGNVVPNEFPSWFDTIMQVAGFVYVNGGMVYDDGTMPADLPRTRALVCGEANPWRLMAKDRTNRCAMIEKPDLGELLDRMNHPS